MDDDRPQPTGWRERKRRETLQRITQSALKLFFQNGYEETTLDAVAEAAGISRRTFFHYFKSKEDIVLTWQQNFPEMVRLAVLAESNQQPPLAAILSAKLKLLADLDIGRAKVVDCILRSNEQLRAGNQAKYVRVEQAIFEALRERWSHLPLQTLRMVAMVSVGATRLAMDSWTDDEGRHPVEHYLRESFALVRVDEPALNGERAP